MTKFCGSCQQDKPITEFAKNASKKDGLQTSCRGCQKGWSKARYQLTKEQHKESNRKRRLRNQLAVYEYLKGKKCVDCREDNPLVLTFDHIRGKKLDNVSDMSRQSWGLQTIFAEIAKCEIRCFNCHMLKDCLRMGGKRWLAQSSQNRSPGVDSL